MSEVIVTMAHVRACGLCVKGARAWFDKQGLGFKHFLERGYPASVIEATGDQLGLRVAAKARETEGGKT